MDLTISRPIRILALVGLLAAVAGGGLMMLKPKTQTTGAPPTVAQLRARAHARARAVHGTRPTVTHTSRTRTAPVAAKPATTKKTAAKPAAVARPVVAKPAPAKAAAPKPAPAVAADGLPSALATALQAHPIVVVSLFDPQSQTDAISYAEAKAGAADAGVGFLGVNLLDDTVTAPLTAVLPGGGLLPDPGVLVFSAPGTLVLRLDGFADRAAVAQAAAQALNGRLLSTP